MNLSGTSSIGFSLAATASSRTNLGVHHLFAACRAAARAAEIETQNIGKPFGEFWSEILHNCLVVSALSAACIESYANELYFESTFVGTALSPAASSELYSLVDKGPVLTKYSTALVFRNGKALDLGANPVQNVAALIRLRNSVLHYRSEWSHQQGSHAKLSTYLKHRFSPSPFLPDEPLFPKAWASSSYSNWAIRSTYEFLHYFYSQAGMPSPLASFKQQIEQLFGRPLDLFNQEGIEP